MLEAPRRSRSSACRLSRPRTSTASTGRASWPSSGSRPPRTWRGSGSPSTSCPPAFASSRRSTAWTSATRGGTTAPPQIPEINWTLRLAPRVRGTLAFARCGALAEQLLRCRALHTGYDHAILKPPHNERATPWHQDQAYTEDRGPLCGVHFWIPMHEATVEMGCMHFIPGSHLGEVGPHRRRASAHVMEAETVATSAAVACPLPAGGGTEP